ncbi:MAG: CDP-alcohol phosphatidyltransferase family protein [Bacteroidales bacterium]|nr:CDP-alcohol phosphatidyltransferase family protein [Bacteroidales bacterium]MCF8390783.1 CDP-alcohol phosphatidyltransferase family protein [Bacteroidales bacterium]
MKKNLPNAITILNLASGIMGILFLLQGNISYAIYMILFSSLFDFLDGTAARLLKAYSDIGKTLDSLADVVSFGVLPGLILYSSLSTAGAESGYSAYLPYAGVLVPVFAAIRLAIFDNDTRQKENFRGLPVPANALFIGAMAYIYVNIPDSFLHFDTRSFVYLCIGTSILQVIMIPFISLKFKGMNIKTNLYKYLILIISILFIAIFKWEGIALSLGFYIAFSIIAAKKEPEHQLPEEQMTEE